MVAVEHSVLASMCFAELADLYQFHSAIDSRWEKIGSDVEAVVDALEERKGKNEERCNESIIYSFQCLFDGTTWTS